VLGRPVLVARRYSPLHFVPLHLAISSRQAATQIPVLSSCSLSPSGPLCGSIGRRRYKGSRAVEASAASSNHPNAAEPLFKDQNDTWVDRHAPSSMQPYLKLLRIDRPIGTWLVLLPGWWGLAFAAAPGALPDPLLMTAFGIGAFVMRGAGCTMNDMWDRRFDGQVARTAQRPLATGRISMLKAWTFLGAQLTTGLGVLLSLNWPTIKLGFLAVPLAGLYPAMKRLTSLPQGVLGLAMNYGILMGCTAATGADLLPWLLPELDGIWSGLLGSGGALDAAANTVASISVDGTLPPAAATAASTSHIPLPSLFSLYAGSALWTIVYDTLYAHQDKADDKKLGLKSSALLFGEGKRGRNILFGLAALSGTAWTGAGIMAGLAWPYFLATAASTAHQFWQVKTADFNDRQNLNKRFTSNTKVGWMMLAGLIGGRFLQ
jgi:4-hydroxybenzoate polyprenyltransferase